MKLADALFRESWKAYQVLGEYWDEAHRFEEWEVQPLRGRTLAPEDVEGEFQGLFIVAAQIVSGDAAAQSCYLDLTLPERIAEHHFVMSNGRICRRHGRRAANGTVIPSIGIESSGVYTLFAAKENPSAGIDVLRGALEEAHRKGEVALDLAYLLRDEERFEEAIEAFSVGVEESRSAETLLTIYKERARLYDAIGQRNRAEADRGLYAEAFQKKYGHGPGRHEM